jgi:TolB-like protein/tetratricopeptide (TPR) repeat protein
LSGWPARDFPTSIAVLPFASLDAAQESEYLGEVIAEDLMTSLARSPDLRVVARTSSFQLREKNVSARSVGRDLGAGVLLEGSIRGSPDHLKIAAQLVSAASGFDLWSESWEGPAGDAPLFEERIVHAVRQVLGKTGKRAPAASAAAIRPPLPGAQEAYWRGRYLLSKGHETRAGSIRFLEEAARADPQFAPAWAGLATAYATMAFHMEEDDVGQLVAKARSAGGRALQLDPASAETLASLAVLSYAFDHDWPGAERGFERALELNPSYARGHLQYAMGLLTRARFDAAIAHIRAARALDPLSYAIGNDLATALECAGRYDEAIASARQTLRNDPTFAFAHVPLGDALAMKGDSTAAIAEFEQAIRTLGRGGWILGPMGYALARAGSKVQAANLAREIGSQDGSGVHLAHIYAGLGDKPRALDALERANAQRIVDLNFMAVDPMLASLRTEPRFLTLKGRLGL